MEHNDPLPIDLFRLISMRGARIWPQNGGKRPGTRFFRFWDPYFAFVCVFFLHEKYALTSVLLLNNLAGAFAREKHVSLTDTCVHTSASRNNRHANNVDPGLHELHPGNP